MNKKETLAKALSDAFIDECSGVVSYIELANIAQEEYPNRAYAQMLRDIAREEHTHKCHIRDIMMNIGVELTDAMKDADNNSENAYREFFC